MQNENEKRTSFFKKIFGQKSSCCSMEIEEIDSNEGQVPASKNNAANCCCCSPTDSDLKKTIDRKK